MGTNSIWRNLSRDSTISEIRLCRSADINHEYVHIIVEGPDDIRFFRFQVSDKVILYESFSGKLGVKEIVSYFSADNVLGICDRDYDICKPIEPLFFYDNSCLETMLMGDTTTFAKVCYTLCPDISDCENIHKRVFQELRWLSLFRKLDARSGFHLNFEAISITKAFNKSNKHLDISILLAQLCNANREFFSTHRDCLAWITKEMQAPIDFDQLISETRGHDCLEMLHCLCRPTKGKDHFNETSILSALICSYDFSSSNLYHDLLSYGYRHNLQIVL